MIMLEASESGWTIPLTERPKHLPDHPGQISLPGGRVEEGESHLEAACREFSEELGTTTFPGECVGELHSIYVYNSDYFVRAFVAVCDQRPAYTPCEREVERVIHLPIEHLLDDSRPIRQEFWRGKANWHSSTIHCDEALIWGATAIILGEFARILRTCSVGDAEPRDNDGVC
jgi:ADP-ribose pyrophosphatase YjhB (NUDIX family)